MQPELAAGPLKDIIYSLQGALAEAGADGVKPYLEQAAQLTPAAIIEDFRAASAGRRLEESLPICKRLYYRLPQTRAAFELHSNSFVNHSRQKLTPSSRRPMPSSFPNGFPPTSAYSSTPSIGFGKRRPMIMSTPLSHGSIADIKT